ncbi:isochorismatase family protein [Mesorhizobium sp. LNHC229A00]|uniref:isochorismatase family protein n=1 Tax=Mesorhizobium sp. LNHC229A00 TaxID=1287240 RepID=UPI0004111778|nr:isochorismatase family protein [Mesorhizobium sp. LNHC229A00]
MIRSSEDIEIPASLAEWCDPRRMALVIYDMQVGICRQIAGAADIVERTGSVLEAARSAGMRVAFTRHLSLPRRWMGATQLRTALAAA